MAEATPEVEQVLRTHAEMWNERDYSKIPDVVSESYVEYDPAAPEGEIHGVDGLEAWMREITSACPDIRGDVIDVFATGETGVAELEFTMTHEGEFNGIPPTEREVEFRAMAKFLLEDGTSEELRNYFDTRELFDQLGVTDGRTTELAGSPPATTTIEENERLAREHFDRVWNRGEIDTDVLADDYRVHTHLGAHETHTLEELRAFTAGMHEAVPDVRKEPDDVFATDEKVTIRYTATGTPEQEFLGIPPTGEEIDIAAVAIYEIADGKLVEGWIVADFLRSLNQLDVLD